MKRAACSMILFSMSFLLAPPIVQAAAGQSGEELFKKHCLLCHHQAAKLQPDIVFMRMRTPVPPMPRFGDEKLSAEDAKKIETYVRRQVEGKN